MGQTASRLSSFMVQLPGGGRPRHPFALHAAAKKGSAEEVAALLQGQADLHRCNEVRTSHTSAAPGLYMFSTTQDAKLALSFSSGPRSACRLAARRVFGVYRLGVHRSTLRRGKGT
jgi:hypothetical protein